jgi:hypothetical protein
LYDACYRPTAVLRASGILAAKPPFPNSYCDPIANPWGIRDHAGPVGGMRDMTEGSGEERTGGSTPAVFITYASQDANAALRICDALRTAGLEVWFDQSDLRGGDAWDAAIRRQVKECALFLPVISANTDARSTSPERGLPAIR